MPPRPRGPQPDTAPQDTPDSSIPGPLPGAEPEQAPAPTPAPAAPSTAPLPPVPLIYRNLGRLTVPTDEEEARVAADTARRFTLLTAPFPADEIELLPKPTARENRKGTCSECGGWHGLPAVHLSYVGHAGITMRLNDVDPMWQWEPVAWNADGLPMVDPNGSLWIRLTVLGVTRLGVGDAEGKRGTSASKEMVGDAIRNAAMRFGVGTYLWSKSEKAAALIARDGETVSAQTPPPPDTEQAPLTPRDVVAAIEDAARVIGKPIDELTAKFRKHQGDIEVEALDTLPLMTLVDFRRSLEPYVMQAMRAADQPPADSP